MFTRVYLCLPLLLVHYNIVYPYLLVFTYVYLFTYVYSYLAIFAVSCACLPMFSPVYSCLSKFIRFYLVLHLLT